MVKKEKQVVLDQHQPIVKKLRAQAKKEKAQADSQTLIKDKALLKGLRVTLSHENLAGNTGNSDGRPNTCVRGD